MNFSRLIFLGFLILVVTLQPADAGSKTSPKEAEKFIQKLGNDAVRLLSEKSIALSEREKQIRELLRKNFALDTIGRFVMSRSWRTATPEQRDEYLNLFSEYVLRTYSRRIGGYANETFTIETAKPLGRRDAVVLTEIKRHAGQPLKAGWRVRDTKNGFKIIDVIVEGVSMAATQRSEFETIVREHGVAGLIETLRAKVSSFSARSS